MLRALFQLNDVSDGFWDGRRFQLFFDFRVIGFMKFSEQVVGSDNKRKSSFKK